MRARPTRSIRHLTMLVLSVTCAIVLAACSGGAEPGAGSATDGTTRDVDHARGTSSVPTTPQRVVVLEPVQLDTSVALGVIPIGSAVLSEKTGIPAYLGEEAADIAMVGTVSEPSVEKIAALKPDLILGTESRHSALYDQLSQVAPTVFMATQTDPWQDNVKLVAEALGQPDAATTLLSDYQTRCDEIAEKHQTKGKTAQLVRPRDDVLTLYGPRSFAGSTLECAGFTTPEHDWEDISLDISPERVLDAKADLVLVTTTDVNDQSTLPKSISSNSDAFPNLHLVDRAFWITGVGPKGGMTVLDDLDRILSSQ